MHSQQLHGGSSCRLAIRLVESARSVAVARGVTFDKFQQNGSRGCALAEFDLRNSPRRKAIAVTGDVARLTLEQVRATFSGSRETRTSSEAALV